MRLFKPVLALVLACLLLMPVAAYNGSQLVRAPVQDFTLTTQDGLTYEFQRQDEPVMVEWQICFCSC